MNVAIKSASPAFGMVVIIVALVGLGPLSTDMYLATLPTLAQAMDAGVAEVQMTLSVFLVGFAVCQLVYGPLSDRLGRRPVMLGGLLLFVAGSVGCAAATSIETLIVWRFFQAVGGCAGPVLGRAIVRDLYGSQDSARILSYVGTAIAVAPAVAPLIGAYMAVWWGWTSIFILLAVYGVFGTLFYALFVPETSPEWHAGGSRGHFIDDYRRLLGDRRYTGHVLASSSVFAGLFAFISGSPFVLIEHFGVPERQFGLYFGLVVLGYMAGTLTGARLSHRYGIARLLRAGVLVALAAGSAMLLLTTVQDSLIAVVLPMVVYTAGVGLVMPQAMAGALAPFPEMAGTASALFGFVQMSAAALVGIAVGHLHTGTELTMVVAIALMGVAASVIYLTRLRR